MKKSKIILYSFSFLVVPILIVYLIYFSLLVNTNYEKPIIIAHAGGEIDGKIYTNTLEAVVENYNNGVRYFEIDFMLSSDNKLICVHEWENDFYGSYSQNNLPTYAEFENISIKTKNLTLTPLNSDRIKLLLNKYPDLKIITDTKLETNENFYKTICTEFADYLNQIIVQVYSFEEVNYLKNYNVKIILTLYKKLEFLVNILAFAEENQNKIFGITTHYLNYNINLAKKLKSLNINYFVHTINSKNVSEWLYLTGCTGIYTDNLFN